MIFLPLWIATWSKKSDKSCCNKLPQEMMRNLPVPVLEEDIDEMFNFADQDQDGKISWRWSAPTTIIIIIIIIIIVTVIFIITMNRFNQNGKLSWRCSTWSVSPSSSSAPTKNKLCGFGTFEGFGFSFEEFGLGKKSWFQFQNSWSRKKDSVSVSENLVSENKSRFRFLRIWSRKKVSVSENLV